LAKCRGLCKGQPVKAHYIDGFKRCGNCGKFIKTTEISCFCCKLKLRTKPSAGIRRHRYNEHNPPHRI